MITSWTPPSVTIIPHPTIMQAANLSQAAMIAGVPMIMAWLGRLGKSGPERIPAGASMGNATPL